MKENKTTKCDPCERDFEHNIHELVKEGKAPTHEAREKRHDEVKTAFATHRPGTQPSKGNSASHATMHTTPKPAPAKQAARTGAVKMKK